MKKLLENLYSKKSQNYLNIVANYRSLHWLKSHTILITDRSYIPFITMMSVFLTVISLVLSFTGITFKTIILFIISIASLGTSIFFWMKSLSMEGEYRNLNTILVRRDFLTGMICFIISEIMLFFGFFWAFFSSSLSPAVFVGGVWPPIGIITLDPTSLPLVNTLLLLTSGVSINMFYYKLKALNFDFLDDSTAVKYISFKDLLQCYKNNPKVVFNFGNDINVNNSEGGIEKSTSTNIVFSGVLNKENSISEPEVFSMDDIRNALEIYKQIKIAQSKAIYYAFSLLYIIDCVKIQPLNKKRKPRYLFEHQLFTRVFKKEDFRAKRITYMENEETTEEEIAEAEKLVNERLLIQYNYEAKALSTLLKPVLLPTTRVFELNIFLCSFVFNNIREQRITHISLEIYRIFFSLGITIFLGILFLVFQVIEYTSHATFGLGNLYGSIFFFTTGLHGMHVFVGLVSLIITFLRLQKGRFIYNFRPHSQVTCVVWYWHFVDIVWLFLFFFIYIWGN